MDGEVRVRLATAEDRPRVLAFHRALYVDNRASVLDQDDLDASAYRDFEQVLRDDVDALLERDRFLVFVAELGGRPCGYITGHVARRRAACFPAAAPSRTGTSRPMQAGGGVGRALMESLLARFRGLGCDVAESRTWAGNEGARAVHERRDRVEKMEDYAALGVPSYWLVDPALRSFEAFELGADGRYVRALGATGGAVEPPGTKDLIIELDALWAELDRLGPESS